MKMASRLTAIRPVDSPRIVRLARIARCFASLARTAAVTQVAGRYSRALPTSGGSADLWELLQHRKNRAITAGKASLFDVRDFSNSITPVFDSEIFERDNKRFFLFDRDHVIFVFEKEGHL